MLCDNCKSREATVHVKQERNGIVNEYNLCPVCAHELERSDKSSLNDIFDGLFNSMFWGPSSFKYMQGQAQKTKTRQCPRCGLNEEELLKGGFLGCPECYKVFADILTPVFKRLQGHTEQAIEKQLEDHDNANSFSELGVKANVKNKISQLKAEQDAAVEIEDYEKAAKLRDQIKKLEECNREE